MVRNGGKNDRGGKRNPTETTRELEGDVDALFGLSLAEFTGARNTLAARLKQAGRGDEANRVKALVKPSISAWAVNQLYWQHREAFDQLMATGQRFRRVQTSRSAGKVAEIHETLDARRKALSNLSELATAILRDTGHNPTPDTVRRITTTLEALSAYASLPGGTLPGRLTHDVDPPGFESLASLMPGAGVTRLTVVPAQVPQSQKSASAATNRRPKISSAGEVRRLEDTRKARIAAAKASLQDAKRVLSEAQAMEQSAEAAQKRANAEAKEAEKHRREAEQRFEKARSASEFAGRRARSAVAVAEEAAKAVEDAKRAVEKASKELEVLVRA
jgi:hypothetical protein